MFLSISLASPFPGPSTVSLAIPTQLSHCWFLLLTQTLKFSRPKISILFSLQSSSQGKPFHFMTSSIICIQQSPNIFFQPRTLFLALDPYVNCLHDTFTCIPHRSLKFNIAHAKSRYFPVESSLPSAISISLHRTIHSVAVSLLRESTMIPASSSCPIYNWEFSLV